MVYRANNSRVELSHFIVTGGAGFIGSHVTDQLLTAGHRVTVVDNLSTGRLANLPAHAQLSLFQKDLADCIPSDFTQPVDGIAHLAATPSVELSWLQPLPAHHNNLSTTLKTLELCHQLQCPRFVFASSAAVYGVPQRLPIAEDHPTLPISPYGLQKLASEQYGHLFAQRWGFCFVALRLFNVFGDRQDPSSPYSGVISKFIAAMQKNEPIVLYGDGSQTRDFISVRSVAAAFLKALTVASIPSSMLNIGSGQAISLLDLIEILHKTHPEWQRSFSYKPSRAGDIKHSQADVTEARQYLGFKPRQAMIDPAELPNSLSRI